MAQKFTPSNIISYQGYNHKGVFFQGYEHKSAWMDIDGELCCVWKLGEGDNHAKVVTLSRDMYKIMLTSTPSAPLYVAYDKLVISLYGNSINQNLQDSTIASITIDFDNDTISKVSCEDYYNKVETSRIAQNFWSIGTDNEWENYDAIHDIVGSDMFLQQQYIEAGSSSFAYVYGDPPRTQSAMKDDTFTEYGISGYRIRTAMSHKIVSDSITLHNDENNEQAAFNYFLATTSMSSYNTILETYALLNTYIKNNRIIYYSTNSNYKRTGFFFWDRLCRYSPYTDPSGTTPSYEYEHNSIYMGYLSQGSINLTSGSGVYHLQYSNYPSNEYYTKTDGSYNHTWYPNVSRDYALKCVASHYSEDGATTDETTVYLVRYGIDLSYEVKTWNLTELYNITSISGIREISRPNNTTSAVIGNRLYIKDDVITEVKIPSESSVQNYVAGYAYSDKLNCDYALVKVYDYHNYRYPVYSLACYKVSSGTYTKLSVDFGDVYSAMSEGGFILANMNYEYTQYANGYWYLMAQKSYSDDIKIIRFTIPELNTYKGE